MGYCRIVAQPAALSIAYSKADLFPRPADPLLPRIVGVAPCELGGDYPEGYRPWRFGLPKSIGCQLEVCTHDSYSRSRGDSDGAADADASRDLSLTGTREHFASYLNLRTPDAAAAFVMPEGYEPGSEETTDPPVLAIFALSDPLFSAFKELYLSSLTRSKARITLFASLLAFPTELVRSRLSSSELLADGMAFDGLLKSMVVFTSDVSFSISTAD